MGKDRKNFEGVRVPIECVATLSELAERLEALHGWRTWSVGGDEIRFVDKDGETGVVCTTGVAYRVHGRRRTVWEDLPNLQPVGCSMSCSNCCFLTCIHVSQETGKMVWYSHFF